MYYIKVIELKKDDDEIKYINYFDKENNKVFYCQKIQNAQCYFSFEEMQKEFEELKDYYYKNRIAIYKIIIEFEM